MGRTPRSGSSEPHPLAASIQDVSQQLGIGDGAGLGRLFAHWVDIVGPSFADHVQPMRVDRECLVVSVDHPAWATQVRHLGTELLDRTAAEAGLPRPERLEVRIRR